MLDKNDLNKIADFCSHENFFNVKLLLNIGFEKRMLDTSKIKQNYIQEIKEMVEVLTTNKTIESKSNHHNLYDGNFDREKLSAPEFLIQKIESNHARECLEAINRYIKYYNILSNNSSLHKDTINIPDKQQKYQTISFIKSQEKPQGKQFLLTPEHVDDNCCRLF